ncbi:hypothetical protein L569_3611 [Bordetella pertussis 2250905]|nr:hypothetical protein L569_3611 [Bordetella pertussis 2250905]
MGLRSHLPELPTPSRCHEILATPLQLASTPPRHRARCTHLQTQPGRIQPIDSSQLGCPSGQPGIQHRGAIS